MKKPKFDEPRQKRRQRALERYKRNAPRAKVAAEHDKDYQSYLDRREAEEKTLEQRLARQA